MIKASVGILTFNSSKSLNDCLKSVKSFDEIIILDGGSTDNTLNIAKKYKCKIKRQPKKFKFKNNKIKDFSKLRNLLLKFSKNNLVLFLDSDEVLERPILKKIDFLSKSKNHKKKYYSFLLGRFPIHNNKIVSQKTIFYPNFQERLFYKSNIKYFIKPVHERTVPKNDIMIKKIIPNKSITFNIDIDYKNIYEKCKYYYQIEKNMVSRKNFVASFNFVFFRFCVILRYIYRNFFFNLKELNLDFRKYEKKLIRIHIFFSFKLLLNIFK